MTRILLIPTDYIVSGSVIIRVICVIRVLFQVDLMILINYS